MIKIFDNKQEAQELCDKIHEWLTANCKNYCAAKWQDSSPDEKGLKWFVQLPAEYDYEMAVDVETGADLTMYPCKELISLNIKDKADRASLTVYKLPEAWTAQAVSVEAMEKLV